MILEYFGYLLTGCTNHKGGTTFECVDEMPDTVSGGHKGEEGAFFHHVEPCCGSLPCPTYEEERADFQLSLLQNFALCHNIIIMHLVILNLLLDL